MKKILLLTLVMSVVLIGMSQKRVFIKHSQKDVAKTREHVQPVDGSEMMENMKNVPLKQSDFLEESIIGQTFYDLQTNAVLTQRLYMFEDGTMAAVWTRGMEATAYPDRGAGYNYFDGTAWGPAPTARIETQRCGWPNIAPLGEDGEIVVSHNAVDDLIINIRTTKGTGAWTETTIPPLAGTVKTTWPRLITSGVNNNTIHVLGHIREEYAGMGTPLAYFRSQDAGAHWDIEYEIIDEIGPNYYNAHSADEAMWAEPRAGQIAFCLTDTWHDFLLMKSDDEGDTWTKTIIWEHPYPFFDWDVTITTDTIWCPDGSGGMALDSQGKAHVVFGIGRVAHFEVGTTYSYWPWTDGVAYWNEDRPPFEHPTNPHKALSVLENLVEDYDLIGWTQDVDSSGTIDFLDELMSYRELGISTMADIAIDELDRMYLAFASTTEGYDNSTYNFKHIWVRGTDDAGATWGDFIDFNTDLIHIFDECIYPVLSLNMDENIHLIYNTDAEPGLALDEDHQAIENNM
ncbi:MAG: hypothetical protein K8R53_00720, partial [Bacteroidales bacterium]|nr:hypothetical protein [Bacteroidales bacterium]